MTAYTDAAAIAAYLGVTFTPEQEAQASVVAEAVTSFVDRYTGRTWQTPSPIVGELDPVLPNVGHFPGNCFGVVYLQRTPATSIDALSLRTGYPNDVVDGVVPVEQFELVDPRNGIVTIAGAGGGWPVIGGTLLALVDYTHDAPPPPDVELAATMIAAGEMGSALTRASIAARPELAGVESIAVGQNDVSVKLSSSATRGAAGSSAAGSAWAAPGSAVAMILDRYRQVVIA